MKNFLIIIIMLLACFNTLKAQQVPQFNHAIFYQSFYNPAYILDQHKPDILLNHRSQWVGFEGSPTTSSLSGSYGFMDNMAGGLTVCNDVLGATKNLSLILSYAYQLKITDEWNMNFGIAWTFMQAQLDGSMVDLYHDNDELVNENLSGKTWKPDANLGIMVSNDMFYGGISSLQVFESKYRLFDDKKGSIAAARHYYVMGGAHFLLGRNETSAIHADITTQMVSGTPARIYLTGLWEYNNSILAGLSYNHTDAIGINVGYKYNDFVILYSYDILTSQLMSSSAGSHEITLGYHLNLDKSSSAYQPMF